MGITVKYFALLREAAGRESETIERRGVRTSVLELLELLGDRNAALGALLRERPVLYAVNREFATGETLLSDGDEVALFPPVSGG